MTNEAPKLRDVAERVLEPMLRNFGPEESEAMRTLLIYHAFYLGAQVMLDTSLMLISQRSFPDTVRMLEMFKKEVRDFHAEVKKELKK